MLENEHDWQTWRARKEAEAEDDLPPFPFRSKSPEEMENHRSAMKRALEMMRGQMRRAGEPDPRFKDSGYPALVRTNEERQFTILADEQGQVVRRQGVKVQPGWSVYAVWAVTFRQAVWLARKKVFASGALEPGVLTIATATGEVTARAGYLSASAPADAPLAQKEEGDR